MSSLRASVIGAGIGGLALANALVHRGIDVRVFEQARQLGDVGAGVALGSNSIRILERIGLKGPLDAYGRRWTRWRFLGSNGHALIEQDMNDSVVGVYRPDLVAMLVENLPAGVVATGRQCVGFHQNADHATVEFADGERVEADLVVGADGIHSILQRNVLVPGNAVFSGCVAYRGVIATDRVQDYPATVSTMWVGEGRHFLVFTLRDGQLINFVGFVPSDATMGESWSAPGDPAVLAREFSGWDPLVHKIISNIDSTFRLGLYDREPLARWSAGRLTLLGDAAHPMLPHMGQGANQSIEDAVGLAEILDTTDRADVADALLRYESLRRGRTSQVQRNSRNGGLVYDSGESPDREERLRGTLADLRWALDYDVEADAKRFRHQPPTPIRPTDCGRIDP